LDKIFFTYKQSKWIKIIFVITAVDIIEQQLDVEHYQHIITVEVEQEKDKRQKLDVTALKIGTLFNLLQFTVYLIFQQFHIII